MSSLKAVLIKVLLFIAAAAGSALFIVWRLYAHQSELNHAYKFLKDAPNATKNEVLKGLEIKEKGLNEKAWRLREEVEEAKKEEIIYAFEKAFGVGSHHSGKFITRDDNDSSGGEPVADD